MRILLAIFPRYQPSPSAQKAIKDKAAKEKAAADAAAQKLLAAAQADREKEAAEAEVMKVLCHHVIMTPLF